MAVLTFPNLRAPHEDAVIPSEGGQSSFTNYLAACAKSQTSGSRQAWRIPRSIGVKASQASAGQKALGLIFALFMSE
jgi:hypothetical protein